MNCDVPTNRTRKKLVCGPHLDLRWRNTESHAEDALKILERRAGTIIEA